MSSGLKNFLNPQKNFLDNVITDPRKQSGDNLNTNLGNFKRYLELDSTFRNRKLYPNPCDFIVDINAATRDTPQSALDPIILAFPYEANLTSGGSTVIQIALSVNSSSIRNFYKGSILEINNIFRKIVSYDEFTQTATVDIAYPFAPPALTPYTIRKEEPLFYNVTTQAQIAVTGIAELDQTPPTRKIRLDATSSSQNDFYNNLYVFIPGATPPASYQYSRILKYFGGPQMAILDTPIIPAITAAGVAYEILKFNRDNVVPIRYSGNLITNYPQQYQISLVYLNIPNRYILNGYGGKLKDYSYIYVALYSSNAKTATSSINSNNPTSLQALFKVPVSFLQINENSQFLCLQFTGMTQTISFRETDSLHFTVLLPLINDNLNFDPLQPSNVLNFEPFNRDIYFKDFLGKFPIESDPIEQVTALFEMIKVS
jgi:hypothetical protein